MDTTRRLRILVGDQAARDRRAPRHAGRARAVDGGDYDFFFSRSHFLRAAWSVISRGVFGGASAGGAPEASSPMSLRKPAARLRCAPEGFFGIAISSP